MRRKLLAAAICTTFTALGLVAITTPAQADPLRNHAGSRFIGYALNLNAQGSDAMYRTVGAREFNSVTAENAMKWDATEPNPNQFSFGQADQVVAAAQANSQQIHGHTLVWHSQTPGWVQSLQGTALLNAMDNHIATVVNRYENSVRSWDVVNEALNEDGSLRQSFWLNNAGIGEQYIDRAFAAANAADPDAELCINDFNTDGMGAKSNGMFALVQRLMQRGVPIDCVGFQGHLAIQFSFPSQVQANFQRFANLGLNVKITELDVRMQNPSDTTKFNTQATYFRNMVSACLGVGARCNQITFWGFTDRYTWVPDTFPNECCPLLYDQNYNPKPAYTAVHDALGGGSSDTTPPTVPGTPTVSGVTSNSASLAWTASTDSGGSGLAGYNVYRRQGTTDTLLTQTTTNSAALTALTPATQYTVVVRARDGAGNLSNPSGAAAFTTQQGTGGGTCRVLYSANNWGTGSNGFTANLQITNTGTAAINGWTLAFSFGSGQQVTLPGWSATWAQSGANVTATPLSWNTNLAPNGSTSIGFNGTHTGSNPAPTSFTLNGSNCTTS